jgi:TraM recognition site of TraD and TraG
MASPYEISRATQIVDVRPWGTRMAEKLADPFLLSLLVGGCLAFTVLAPILMLVTVPLVITLMIASRSATAVLPIRYPPSAVNPQTGKKGDGIWFLGNMVYEKDKDKRLPLESAADAFKEVWFADDDMRKHLLVLGSTGSGKSELLKGIFFCALCWGSGFFVADGKADNKLPLDNYNMARFFGRDDDLLTLNFLLAGKSPAQVRNSRKRRTNKTNPFSTADADTIIQMGANLLPKVDGDAKNWQEKALNCWRGLVPALCWLRDNEAMEISATTFVEYLSLAKIEELYIKGFRLAQENGGVWLEDFNGIKTYLEVGVPGFKVDRCLKKYGMSSGPRAMPTGKPEPTDQDPGVYDQHGYRATQLNPSLGLLGKTYGHIFQDKYSEIDMIDVTLNNRILILLIPSLEKSAQEAESLGKLTVACLRIMMGKNLGAEIEGTRQDLLESKATEAPYPYVVALDELGYYFADGIAVMFAQARSLGFCMIAAAQDIEKLTEGPRAAEAGAMLANQVGKIFMRIDDANKTNEMIQKYLGKVNVALKMTYEFQEGFGFKRMPEVKLEEIPVATLKNLQELDPGRAVLNSMGKTFKIASFYVGSFLQKYPSQTFHVNRFLQVRGLTESEIKEGIEVDGIREMVSLPIDVLNDPSIKGVKMKDLLTGRTRMPDLRAVADAASYSPKHDKALDLINVVAITADKLAPNVVGGRRAIALYLAAKKFVLDARAAEIAPGGGRSGGDVLSDRSQNKINPAVVDGFAEEFVTVGEAALAASTVAAATIIGTAATVADSDGANILAGSGSGVGPDSIAAPHDDDPFDFLNDEKPLTRKPIAEVFAAVVSIPFVEAVSADPALAATGPAKVMIGDVREILNEGGLRYTAVSGSADVTADPLDQEVRPLVNLSEGLAHGLQSMLSQGSMVDLNSLRISRAGGAIQKAAGDAAWIERALKESSQGLMGKGDTVMGFTDATKTSFIRVEEALGNLNPGESAAAIEQLVAQQTTPAPLDQSVTATDFDDIDMLLNNAEAANGS